MKHTKVLGLFAFAGALFATLPALAQAVEVEKSIKGYAPAAGSEASIIPARASEPIIVVLLIVSFSSVSDGG